MLGPRPVCVNISSGESRGHLPMNDLDAGRAALARGDWPAARLAFDAAVLAEESPEALEGLGHAAWWLDLADVVFDVRERAYRLYQQRGDRVGAARMAV